jgi:coproporphyrinogen III oxidase
MVPTVHANWRYFEMYDERKGNSTMVWWGQDLTLIICLKKMQFIFTNVKPLDKHNQVLSKYKSNVMPISGTHIVMKHVE